MKKVLGVLFVLLSLTTIVNAKTYNVASENMMISLSDDYIDLLSEYEENEQILTSIIPKENYDKYVESYKKQGTIIDAVKLDENNKIKLEVIVGTSKLTKNISARDLKYFNEQELEEYKQKFMEVLKAQAESSQMEVVEDDIYRTEAEDVYIRVHTVKENQQIESFYTVRNFKLIRVNIQYTEQIAQIDSMAEEIVNNIQIKDTTYDEQYNYFLSIIGTSIVCILTIVVAIYNKATHKKKAEITKEQEEKYSKFGGFLIIYVLLLVLNAISLAISIIIYIVHSNVIVYAMELVRSVIMLVYMLISLKNIRTRSIDTPKKIIKHMYIMLAISIIVAISSLTYSLVDTETVYMPEFYVSQLLNLISSVTRTVLFVAYFSISTRVKVYYGEYNMKK